MTAKKIFNAAPTKTTAKKSPPSRVSVKRATNKKEDVGLPLSVVIRRRIEAQKARFHANDNIAAFIKPGELEVQLMRYLKRYKPF